MGAGAGRAARRAFEWTAVARITSGASQRASHYECNDRKFSSVYYDVEFADVFADWRRAGE